MRSMFYRASYFNQPLGQWNVESVTTMQTMFSNAYSFNQPLEQWNVDSATIIKDMFCGATNMIEEYKPQSRS
jgi:hypothetical protein